MPAAAGAAVDEVTPPPTTTGAPAARSGTRRASPSPMRHARTPASGGGGPPRRPRRSSPGWRYGFPAALISLFLLAGVLSWTGYRTVLGSTDGTFVAPTNPTDPGWEAITEPTPTMLLLQVDADNELNSVTVLSLTSENSGGVILIPRTAVLGIPGIGPIPLDKAYATSGQQGVQRGVEAILTAGMAEVQVIEESQWADLVGPVGSIALQSSDVVGDGTGKVFFPKGNLTLPPQQVGSYLGTITPGTDDGNRLLRQQAFWRVWLDKVKAGRDNPNILPGEAASGLGRFVRALSTSQVNIQPLPVHGVDTFTGTIYEPVPEGVQQLVSQLIPFPVSAIPGARIRTRVLDGTGRLDHGVSAAPTLVRGGAQIDAVGNASRFDYTKTQLVYADEAMRPQVERLREALGVGELSKTASTTQAVDVTVILGTDYAALPIASQGTSVVTSTALPANGSSTAGNAGTNRGG